MPETSAKPSRILDNCCGTGVAVEKGTKAVISVNFSVCGQRTFNNLRTTCLLKFPEKEFFNSHACSHQLLSQDRGIDDECSGEPISFQQQSREATALAQTHAAGSR